jgi:hypothetical protein
MQTGTTYWSIQIDSWTLKQNLSKEEYRPTLRKLQSELKSELKYKTDFKTPESAKIAYDKLPQYLKDTAKVEELTPIYGIL